MKNSIVFEVLLICIFGTAGWYLFGVMKQLESNNPGRDAIEANNSLVFTGGAGMDIMGNMVNSVFTNKSDESERIVAAFLIRYNSLDADLKFWNEVNSHLSGLDTIRLTAYCENIKCIDAIRNNPEKLHFIILEYGGAMDMQSIINADAAGEFWLRGDRPARINWRDGDLTPLNIAMRIGMN